MNIPLINEIIHLKEFNLLEKYINLENFINNYEINSEIMIDINFNIYYLIDLIIHSIIIKPLKLNHLINFINIIIEKIENKSEFKNILLQKSLLNLPYLTFKLYKNNFFTQLEIKNIISQEKYPFSIFYFYDIFEIKNLYLSKSILKKAKINLSELFQNNFKLLKEKIEFGWYLNSLGYFIKFDDFQNFQILIENSKININNKLYVDKFEFFLEEKFYNLISLSALYNSINCFKFLMLKKVKLPSDLGFHCLISGNFELIHNFDNFLIKNSIESLEICFKYRYFEIFKWLNQFTLLQTSNLLFHLKNFDIIGFYYFFINLNEKKLINNYNDLLLFLTQNNYSEIIEFLIKYGYDIFQKTSKSLIEIAKENKFNLIIDILNKREEFINKCINLINTNNLIELKNLNLNVYDINCNDYVKILNFNLKFLF